MACHDVGHMCIHQILPLEMAYFGPVKFQPIYFGLSFGSEYCKKFLRSCLLKSDRADFKPDCPCVKNH